MIGKLKLYAIAAFVFLASIITFGAVKYRKGVNNNQRKQEEIDHETASDIRDRADRVKRVPDDKLKFRD